MTMLLGSGCRKKTEKYTSHEVQNEILELMALRVLREICEFLHSTEFYTVMIDECTDVSNQEQVAIILRWVDDQLTPHEEFIGLYAVPSIDSSMLVSIIKDTLVRMNLSLSKLRGQCYDGASNMRGVRNGVAKQLQDVESRAIYIHCYGHSLSLAASDAIQHCKLMKTSLETTHEITKLVKYSPRREGLFDQIKGELTPDSPGVRVLCPMRWTVRAASMHSVIQNYSVLQELWEKAVDVVRDTETIARIRGVAAQMTSFDFFFGLVLGEMLLRHCDNLSKTLQNPHLSAAEGQTVADMTKRTLATLRAEDQFELFWEKVRKMTSELDVKEPQLPRRRKVPLRYESGKAPAEYHSTPKVYYRQIFYEALDLITQAIESRFDQPGYRTYRCLEDLVLKAANKEDYSEELKAVTSVYGSDIDAPTLQTQLQVLSANVSEKVTNVHDIIAYLRKLSSAEQRLLSAVIVVIKLILVLPATNASSERSFSAMRRIKSYLRSTMSQGRLNHIMVLSVHKDLTDKLNLVDVANDFVSASENCLRVFGHFSV